MSNPRWTPRQHEIEMVTRAARQAIARYNPARLPRREAKATRGDAYADTAIDVARTLLEGGTMDDAMRVLRKDVLERFGTRPRGSRMLKIEHALTDMQARLPRLRASFPDWLSDGRP